MLSPHHRLHIRNPTYAVCFVKYKLSIRNLTTTGTPPAEDDATRISHLILKLEPEALIQNLKTQSVCWTPDLVNNILKRIWNHGPKAIQFFNLVERRPKYAHTATSFDYAIDIAARLRNYKTMWKLVERMQKQRLGPNAKTFAIITERYASAGKPDKAIKVFLSMHEYGCEQDLNSFNMFLDALCKSRHVEMAYNLLKVLKRRFRADTISYNIIANGFCLMKRTPRALEVFREMVNRGLKPTLKTYNVILNGYVKRHQMKEAWMFFKEMKRRKCEIDVVTYTTVVHGFGVVGEIQKARQVFDEMIGSGVLPSIATYNAFIQVLCKKDNVENAILVFEEMLKKGYTPNATTYTVLIRGLCQVGKMDRAMEYVDKMKRDECGLNVQTYNMIIRYYCDEGEIEKSLKVFEGMGSGECLPNFDSYNVLISAMFVRKRSDDLMVAGKLLMEMVDRGFIPQKINFNRILNGLLLTGNQDFAKEILRAHSKFGHLPRHFKL